jgi:hypothetical protein
VYVSATDSLELIVSDIGLGVEYVYESEMEIEESELRT